MSISSIYNIGNQQSDNTDAYFKSVTAESINSNSSVKLPSLVALKSADTQASGTSSITEVNYDSVEGSLSNNFDIVSGEFTAPSDGYYLINFFLTYSPSAIAGDFRMASLRINSTNISQSLMSNIGGLLSPSVCSILKLSQGDIVDGRKFQNSGGPLTNSNIMFSVMMITN